MSTPEEMRARVLEHFELWNTGHDEPSVFERWLDLFTPDCSIEEPVGTPIRRGMQRVGWANGHSADRRTRIEPVLVIASANGPEAASVARVVVESAGATLAFDYVGVWTFADDGRIASSRIFVDSFSELGPAAWTRPAH